MTRIPFILLSTSDGSPLTGVTPSVTISKDGAAFTAATNTPAEIGNGYYYVDLTTAETTVNNNVIVRATATGAQPTAVVWEPEQDLSGLSTFDPTTDYVTINPLQATTFATAGALTYVQERVLDVKAKTDNLPQNPAAVGSEMALNSTAISAVQSGLATGQGLENLATYGDAHWSTATGFATPSDLEGLATDDGIANSLDALETYGDSHWATADVTGLAEKTDIPTDYAKPTDIPTEDITAIKTKVDSLHNTDLTGVATALSVEKIHAGLFNWSLDEDVINAKNTSGTVIVSSTITRDSSGNITAMEEDND